MILPGRVGASRRGPPPDIGTKLDDICGAGTFGSVAAGIFKIAVVEIPRSGPAMFEPKLDQVK